MSDAPAQPEPPAPNPGNGALIVSCAILGLFAFTVVGSAFGLAVNPDLARLLETALTLVVGYWLGSSNGSRVKDMVLAAVRR